MKPRVLFFIVSMLIYILQMDAQQSANVSIKISKDTLLQGETIKVEYLLNNIEGNFSSPEFEGFRIVSGPNTSSSFTMINGVTTSRISYSYMLRAENSGVFFIPAIVVDSKSGPVYTEEISIVVLPEDLPNVRNVHTKEFKFNSTKEAPVKEKKKLKRI